MNWLNSFEKQSLRLSDLARTIMSVSYKCGQEFLESIGKKTNKKLTKSGKEMIIWAQVQYEFLFFFTHLTMRSAFLKLGNEKRIKLQNLLGPILVDMTTEAWFGHWPKKLREGIKKDFFHNINVAEMDYSECKGGLLIKDHPFSKDGLFSRLAINIARLSGHENNPEVIVRCIEISIKRFSEIKLNNLITAVGKEI